MNFEFSLIFVCFIINGCTSCCTKFPWLFFCSNPFVGPLDRVIFNDTKEYSSKDMFNLHHAFTFDNMKWTNNTVIYEIDEEFNEVERNRIFSGFAEIQNSSCIRFEPRTSSSEHYVRIHKDYTNRHSAFSEVGYYGDGVQNVWFGADRLYGDDHNALEYRHTILHELLHTLGFEHHHMRSDRDIYIKFNVENMNLDDPSHIKGNYWRMVLPDPRVRFLTPFDYDSVLLYDSRKASRNGSITIQSRKYGIKVPDHHIDHGLSRYDKILLNKFYNCTQKKIVVKAP